MSEALIYEYCLANNKPYFGRYLEATLLHPSRGPHMFWLAKTEITRLARPVKFLEIGSWTGGSTLIWAEAIKSALTETNMEELPGRKSIVLCVDPWQPYFDATLPSDHPDFHSNYKGMQDALEKDAVYGLFWHNLKSAGHTDRVCSIRTRSDNILPLLGPEQFDLVYIDGKHDYDSVFQDLTLSMPLIRDGGILCGDDLEKQQFEIDSEYARAKKQMDFIEEPQTNYGYHPGVTLAVNELLGEVSTWEGFWAMRKVGQEWQKVEVEMFHQHSISLPSYLKGFGGWSGEEQQAFIEWLRTQYPQQLQQLFDSRGEFVKDTSNWFPQPVLLVESYREFNIIGYQNQVFAILQSEGAFSIERIHSNGYSRIFIGTSIEAVKQAIDSYDGGAYYSTPVILIESYRGFKIVGYQNRIYAIPHSERNFDLNRINDSNYNRSFISGVSTKGVLQLVDNALA